MDIESLDESIKLRALGRLLTTKHPYVSLIKAGLDFNQYFYPKDTIGLDRLASKAIELLKLDRDKAWELEGLSYHRNLLNAIGDMGLKSIVDNRGRNSIPFFLKWTAGARFLKDLTIADLRDLRGYIKPTKITLIENSIRTNSRRVDPDFLYTYFIKDVAKPLEKLSSKQIREARANTEPITDYKLGIISTKSESLSWGLKLSKLSSIKHRNILLRVAHGEIYTKEKLCRFKMINSSDCPRCGALENLQHKFIECSYSARIWRIVLNSCKNIVTTDPLSQQKARAIVGAYLDTNPTILTINAEILLRILSLKDDENHLIHPKHFVRNALKYLVRREKKEEIKRNLKSVLDSLA